MPDSEIGHRAATRVADDRQPGALTELFDGAGHQFVIVRLGNDSEVARPLIFVVQFGRQQPDRVPVRGVARGVRPVDVAHSQTDPLSVRVIRHLDLLPRCHDESPAGEVGLIDVGPLANGDFDYDP
ncbi:hypothetical protein [Mycobacterium paragordonae]|uniref:Uncharacterized protein n=1 Tax=Mycobacterium paragordonae TaxID=1389713 RepID=A0A4R5WX08_9MYCO|nr:hypothetical protein [Mycobacterium paragordonae]MDP7736324.1 hypothetical protein [Mycobacterium paragordonae]TDK97028.1 hypothetical protein EI067_13535 [Mycobacterium paragordonae]TDK99563.1 hypothetical protein EUA02_06290 [Mycobacterium paragordonae]TDL06085.1 hypothetical protein EUA05_17300 [Mycobacterium paragordonae]